MKRFTLSLAAILSLGALSLQAAEDSNLSSTLEDLGGVITVTPDRVSEPLKDTTANVTVVTSKEIQERGYRTVADAVSRISGFSTASNGGPGQTSGIFLRGFNSGNILILLDGVPLKDPTDPSFSAGLAHLQLDDVERIEVVKGAQSGIWGADAVAGVINIITKKAAPDGHVSLRGQVGSYDTKSAGITLSAAGEAGSFVLSGDHYKTDGFSAYRPRNAEADGYTNDTLHFRGTLNMGNDATMGIFYHDIKGDFDYDSGWPTNPNDSLSNGTFKDRLMGVKYDYDNGSYSLHGSFSNNLIDRNYYYGEIPIYSTHGESTRATLNGSWKIDDHQQLSGGFDYNRIEGQTPFANGGKPSAYSNRGFFGTYRYIFDDILGARTIINATLRYDDFSAFKSKSTYRFGLKRVCNSIPGFFTSANIYSAYKAPSIYQWTKPRPGDLLKPEYTKGFEISTGYKELLKITYFRNKNEDRILPGGSWPNDFYYNSQASDTLDGIELESRYRITAIDTELSANWTHMFSLSDNNGDPILRVPRNEGNLFVDYTFNPDIHIGANLLYVGKRTDYGNVELGSYTLVNLSYNQQVTKNFTFSLQAHNIFDRDYETVAGYSTEGRSVYGKVEYKF